MTGKGGVADADLLRHELAAQPIRIAGRVKWFDPGKGYGFVLPDDPSLGDVLLHMRCLQQGGFAIVAEGAGIVCVVQRGRRGLQTIKVLSIDMSLVACFAGTPRAASPAQDGPLHRARVKWFNHLKGFGFLKREEGATDVFVHVETLKKFGVFEIRPGLPMLIRFADSGKGLIAVEIHPDLIESTGTAL